MLGRRKRLPPRLDHTRRVDIDLNDHHGRRAYVSFATPSAWQGTFEASVPQPAASTIISALKAEASMSTSPSAKKAIADAIESVEGYDTGAGLGFKTEGGLPPRTPVAQGDMMEAFLNDAEARLQDSSTPPQTPMSTTTPKSREERVASRFQRRFKQVVETVRAMSPELRRSNRPIQPPKKFTPSSLSKSGPSAAS